MSDHQPHNHGPIEPKPLGPAVSTAAHGPAAISALLALPSLDKARVGPFILTKRLTPSVMGERWLALRYDGLTSHVVHRFRVWRDKLDREKFMAVMEQAATLNHPHILKIEHFGFDHRSRPYCATPYTGASTGVLTLEGLLRQKSGAMAPEEAKRLAEHVLSAIAHAHALGCQHGPLGMNEVLVDPRGRVQIELYGVAAMLGHPENIDQEQRRREVVATLQMVYQVLTGLRAEEPLLPPTRVLPDLDPTWNDLFATGLSEPGFTSAAHALSALRACRTSGDGPWTFERLRLVIKRILMSGM